MIERIPTSAFLAMNRYSFVAVHAVLSAGGERTHEGIVFHATRYRAASLAEVAAGVCSAIGSGLLVKISDGPRTSGPTYGLGPAMTENYG